MPLLGSLFTALFGGLFSALVAAVGVRFAIAAGAVSAFSVLTLGLYAATAALLAGIVATMPGGWGISTIIWVVVPDIAPACVAAIVACDGLCALYRWNVGIVRLAAS